MSQHKETMSYHIMEIYVTTCRMSRLSRHPYACIHDHHTYIILYKTIVYVHSFVNISVGDIYIKKNYL